ncbi:aspartyl-phosphate phosphatase Spo0E family protein [Paenibacillus bovis]|uniref:Uncharacterized protein n=1 Tax=Paenibacillus bovis TaxID=1616788 RepID=A0A1X9T4D7_9BACL|nr:aspartyl-phosphate phosphatase Spo0E family protein [Paenibacillus bovis]ARR10702.1 hypothetical protein AR543_p0094 [Paenibacillus bovis]
MNQIEQLAAQIEAARTELNQLVIDSTSLCSGIMLKKSKLLDDLLNRYQSKLQTMKKPVA